MSLNRVSIMGRIGRDPELRMTGNGTPVTTISLAVERDFSDDGGKRPVDWIDVVAWKKTAEFITKYFRRGQLAVVDGSLRQRSWEKDGQKHSTVEVLADRIYFADSKPSGATASAEPGEFQVIEGDDSELPF